MTEEIQNPYLGQAQNGASKLPQISSVGANSTPIAAPILQEPDKLFELIDRQCIPLSEAAKLTGYAEDYLGQRARLGELKAIKVGRNWITHRSCLDDFCKTHPGHIPTGLKGLGVYRKSGAVIIREIILN